MSMLMVMLPFLAFADAATLTLYGALTKSASSTTMTAGIYSFETQSALNMKRLVEFETKNIVCGAYANDLLYTYVQGGESYNPTFTFTVYDVNTGEAKISKYVGNAQKRPSAMCYNPADKKLYGYLNALQTFYEINAETGELTEVGKYISESVYFNSLFCDASGKFYATSSAGNFYSLDIKESKATLVGELGFSDSNPAASTVEIRSGRFFIIKSPAYGSNRWLMEIDPKTGATTELASFPYQQQIKVLYAPIAASEKDSQVPGFPTDVKTTFKVAGQNAATLQATAPTKAFDQETTLTSPMTVTFFVDDVKVGKVDNVAPGAVAKFDYTFTAAGAHVVKAQTSNAAGEGLSAQTRTFVGFDTPVAVGDIKLEIADNGKTTLTWTAPSVGVNNGDVNAAALAYDIVRFPGAVEVAKDLKATTFSETISYTYLRDYYYQVVAKAGEQVSEKGVSNRVAHGEGIRLPFVEDFDNDVNWGLHTIIDENDDDNSWKLDVEQSYAICRGNKNMSTDWLLTPRVKMTKDVVYTINFSTSASFNQTGLVDIYVLDSPEVPWGGAAALTPIQKLQLTTTVPTPGSATFVPEKDGYYYFAFYNYSNPNVHFYVHGYTISASQSPKAPADVEDLTMTPGEKGAFEATLNFTAPTKCGDGSALPANGISEIEIYHGDSKTPIHVISNPTPGAELTYVDNTNAYHGTNLYTVVCYNGNGNSAGRSVSAWIGEDLATAPNNVRATLNEKTRVVTLTWSNPSGGYRGGYIDFENLRFNIEFFVSGGGMEDPITVASRISERRFEISLDNFNQFMTNDRESVSFYIVPVTSAGEGVPGVASVVSGDAYGLPFAESFAGRSFSTTPWTTVTTEGTNGWAMVDVAPDAAQLAGTPSQDNDGGMAMYFHQMEVAEGRLCGPSISIEGAKDPILTFYLYHRTALATEDNYLLCEGMRGTNDYFPLGEKIAINGFGWEKHMIHLNEAEAVKAGDTKFRLAFHARSNGNTDFYLDNISVTDGLEGSKYPSVTGVSHEFNDDETQVTLSWNAPAASQYTLIGYYIYRDGVKVSNNYTTKTTYTAPYPQDNKGHNYQVQAIYNEGDALLSEDHWVYSSALESIEGESAKVYVLGNTLHIEAEGAPFAVVSTAGLEVARGTVASHEAIELASGIYVVKVGGKVVKCSVR